MALNVPPLDSSAIFTQIPLAKDLIPLDDLGASGGYGRQLILPDDVPPVLALPWALGPKLPRLNRAEDDGSLHVFVTGQSGSKGLSKIAPKVNYGNAGDSTGTNWASSCNDNTNPINTIYALHWTIFSNTKDLRLDTGERATFIIVANFAKTRGIRLGVCALPNVDQNVAMAPYAFSGSLWLPQPLDFAAMWARDVGSPMVGYQVGLTEGNAPLYGGVSIHFD